MKKIRYGVFILLIFSTFTSIGEEKAKVPNEHAREFIRHIFDDNANHVSTLSHEHLKSYVEQQSPRATIVACSDSRVQADAFHQRPINDLFFIRNIGNQIPTTQGSVEYGIYHLHTPILLIIGHSQCGAIKAGLGNYSNELPAIVDELDQLHLTKGISLDNGVIENVNYQVKYALDKFQDKISKNELLVVGAIYDFSDDFGHGHGRLILVNLNGEQDPEKIRKNPFVKGLDHIAIGHKKS